MKNVIIYLSFLFINLFANAQIITTIAGNGFGAGTSIGGYSGDGGPATDAELSSPSSITIDAIGNIYISDTRNQVIRKIDTLGIITTYAGNNTSGFSGDGGLATNAQLSQPSGIAIDRKGNLYIADTYNWRIRKVDKNGIITTIAGDASTNFADNVPATSSSLNAPLGVSTDNFGNVFIADTYHNRIRKVDTLGIITTVAGSSGGGYYGDGGQATDAYLSEPGCTTIDSVGNIYIGDASNRMIRKVNTNGIITRFAGNGNIAFSGDGGPAIYASIDYANGTALDAKGNLYISDGGNLRIRKVNKNGIISTFAGNGLGGYTGDGGPAIYAGITPLDVAIDGKGNMYIADNSNNVIRKISYCPSPITLNVTGSTTVCSGNPSKLTALGAATYTWCSPSDTTYLDSISINPASNTTYTLIGISGGCIAIKTISIVVNNNPTVSVNSSTICATQQTATLVATGANTYTWNTNDTTHSIQVSPLNSTTYTVFGTDTNNCKALATTTVFVNPLPMLSVTSTTTNLCEGNVDTLSVNGAITYTWTTNQTGASIVISPTVTTNYTVSGTDINGCINSTSITQQVSNCNSGVEQFDNSQIIHVYPNPSNGNFSITSNEIPKAIIITDLLGNPLFYFYPKEVTNSINLNNLTNGVYFINVNLTSSKITQSIIINKN